MARTSTTIISDNETSTSQGQDELIGYRDAARLLGIPLGSLYCMVHQRKVPHFRIGARSVRFSRAALATWLQAQAVEAEVRQ